MAVGDFNNDDCMNVAVTNFSNNNIGIFLCYDDLSFTEQETFDISPQSSPYSLAVDDFNNDNRLDIVVANHGIASIDIFLGFGNSYFGN